MNRSVLGDVPVWGTPGQIAHAKQQQATIDRLMAALTVIARGTVPPQKEGHYLAHREAVRLAREAMKPASSVSESTVALEAQRSEQPPSADERGK